MRLRNTVIALLLVAIMVSAASAVALAYQKEVFRVGVPDLPEDLDGFVTMGNAGQRVNFNIYEKLIHFDKDDPTKIVPQLAESWEWLDDITVEFKLRQGVVFHNGKTMTAKDVKYSLDRILVGGPDVADAWTAMLNTIEKVEIVDDYTIRITTYSPDPILETRMASLWGGFIVPEGYVEEVGHEKFMMSPVATGPYKVVSFEPDRIVLEAHEEYWGVKPNVKQLVYVEIPELAARMTALINGEVDLISTIPPDQIPFFDRYNNVQVLSRPISNMHLLTFNMNNAPTNDRLVRQALALAIDRQAIVDALFMGGTEVPRSYQFKEYGSMINYDIPQNEFDPERAKQLLAQSSYNGEVIYYDLVPGSYTGSSEAAEIIAEMWRQYLGLNVQIRFVESAWTNADFNVCPWSNTMRFPEFTAQALQWGKGTSRQSGKGARLTWVETELRQKYNALQEQLEFELDPQKRYDIYQEMLAVWREEVPATELWFAPECWAMAADVVWNPYYAHIMDFSGSNLSFK